MHYKEVMIEFYSRVISRGNVVFKIVMYVPFSVAVINRLKPTFLVYVVTIFAFGSTCKANQRHSSKASKCKIVMRILGNLQLILQWGGHISSNLQKTFHPISEVCLSSLRIFSYTGCCLCVLEKIISWNSMPKIIKSIYSCTSKNSIFREDMSSERIWIPIWIEKCNNS